MFKSIDIEGRNGVCRVQHLTDTSTMSTLFKDIAVVIEGKHVTYRNMVTNLFEPVSFEHLAITKDGLFNVKLTRDSLKGYSLIMVGPITDMHLRIVPIVTMRIIVVGPKNTNIYAVSLVDDTSGSGNFIGLLDGDISAIVTKFKDNIIARLESQAKDPKPESSPVEALSLSERANGNPFKVATEWMTLTRVHEMPIWRLADFIAQNVIITVTVKDHSLLVVYAIKSVCNGGIKMEHLPISAETNSFTIKRDTDLLGIRFAARDTTNTVTPVIESVTAKTV
jgi:hypothetical protein